ncbi:hypothetical protein C8J30_11098 [Rhodobacter viridis]|uniref:Uncharacterized protein n=1 Tax=Rhodobacter viridis TaxID=1054202 RepID=A0A318U4G6_9RHOB|nr:hypothetical protein [Rhodobacter viridis]PYF09225.1 hypothetical protein C8J30_11098 [Rhodobacter viridis]
MGLKSSLTPIIAGWVWISGCEYGINQVWLKSQWEDYYSALGFAYPDDMMKWAAWCFVFALAMRMLVSRFNVLAAGIISWIFVVGLSLVALWNYAPMPVEMFQLYGPASFAETLSAALVISMFVGIAGAVKRSQQRAKEKAKAKLKAKAVAA